MPIYEVTILMTTTYRGSFLIEAINEEEASLITERYSLGIDLGPQNWDTRVIACGQATALTQTGSLIGQHIVDHIRQELIEDGELDQETQVTQET